MVGEKGKVTVTIGIPAYNEEANIGVLVDLLLKQRQDIFTIERIVISSDASTDRTVHIVEGFHDDRVIAIDNRDRKGCTYRQGQIVETTDSDVFIRLDADTQPKNSLFIQKLIEPIVRGEADLTSAALEETPGETPFEEILGTGNEIKRRMFESYNGGANIYTCHGAARAFSRRLYKQFDPGTIIAEDAYSYLYCLTKGLKYRFAGQAVARYRLPASFRDYKKQSLRFRTTRKELFEAFGEEFVQAHFHYPWGLTARAIVSAGIRRPLRTFLYVGLAAYIKARSLFANHTSRGVWETSASTKALRTRA
ncbi:MAG: glycosyltransferase [Bacteroidetes bacterium]|nr:glycosyltransferase [Bacteroidota bacterium]